MANIYVRSSDGSDVDNGSTWALAKATLSGAAAIDAAGDNIYIASTHSESTASTVTLTFASTTAAPVKIISVNDAAQPPTAVATGAAVTTTGNSAITINNAGYVYGITFTAGTGANNVGIALNNTAGHASTYENCNFYLGTTSNSPTVETAGGFSNGRTVLRNCNVRFGAAGQKVFANRATLIWEGGGITSGGTSPTTLFSNPGTLVRSEIYASNLDLSSASSSLNLFTAGAGGTYVIRNSKLPASWSGSLYSGTLVAGERAEMHNCDSGDTNYRLWVEDYTGSIKSETTLVRTGGASDGTTTISWKVVTSANAEYPGIVLETPEVSVWNDTTGSSVTVTVDVLHDSVTNLKDDEVWLEVTYLGTSGFPLGTLITDAKANVLATAADQDASSATWTTTGMANPNKQKLAVTFTPQEKGFIQARVRVAKASYTLYVDPELQVS